MDCANNYNSNPDGTQSTRQQTATGLSDFGESRRAQHKISGISNKLPYNRKTFIGTLNINTLIQTGKLHNLTQEIDQQKIIILALQETRMTDNETMDYGNYRIFKSKTQQRVAKGAPIFGMAFLVHKSIMNSVKDVTPVNNRLMTIRIQSANKKYTLINAHAPTNIDNKKNPETVERFWGQLEDTMSKIHKEDVKIILGDFNAQLGKEKVYRKIIGKNSAHQNTNTNGTHLIDLCQQFNLKVMSTHFRKPTHKQKTWRSPIQHLGEYQIDHVAISHAHYRTIHDIQVRRGANIDSDHYITRVKIKFSPRKVQHKKTHIQKFDISKIQETNITEEWDKEPANNWTDFRNKIIKKAKELIPLNKKTKHPWWNSTCDQAISERRLAFQKYNSQKSPETLQHFLDIRKQTNRTIRRTKRNYVNEQIQMIEENFRNYNSRDFYRTFANTIRGYSAQNLTFRKKDGKLALTNQDNCEELACYFSELLNCPEPPERFVYTVPEHTKPNADPPTQEEIHHHIKRLKNGKTSGEDGIIAELLKSLGPQSLQEITHIIQEIWQTEKLPNEWKCALIHPLHKKGDKSDVNNYRGISLLPVPYKILSACLLQRTQEQIEPLIGEYQAGFRPHRSCIEQIFNLKSTLKFRAIRNLPTICTFVDFHKAYDSIDRQSLFNILEEYNLDPKTNRLIQQTLTDTTSKIKFAGEISQPFPIKTGVRQGDGLSPLLFNIVLDKVIKEWEKELEKTNIWKPIKLGRQRDNINVTCLAFADDLAILSEDEKTAILQIVILKECAEKVGLQISFTKTEFMTTKHIRAQSLVTKYGTIKKVDHFKYLGEIIEPTGTERLTQKTRELKIRKSYGKVANIYNKKCMSVNTKIRHYTTVIKPESLYASETLNLNFKGDLEKIKKAERKIIRKILGPKLTDEGYRLQSHTVTEKYSNIEVDFHKRRLRFYGHIMRLDDTRLTKKILMYLQKLKITTVWIKQVQSDLRDANITTTDLNNRETFKHKVHTWETASKETPKRPRAKWTDERRVRHSEFMKEYWRNKKNGSNSS